jgi:uncharacterized damage-inducible protein DinB
LKNIPQGTATRSTLRSELEASAEAVAGTLADSEKAGKMRGYKRGPIAFCGYLLAHEGHHRGQIILHLKNAKMPVAREAAYGIWEWEKL